MEREGKTRSEGEEGGQRKGGSSLGKMAENVSPDRVDRPGAQGHCQSGQHFTSRGEYQSDSVGGGGDGRG